MSGHFCDRERPLSVALRNLCAVSFFLLYTFVYEMGHGITTLIVGGHFVRIEMWPDGSGNCAGHARVFPRRLPFYRYRNYLQWSGAI